MFVWYLWWLSDDDTRYTCERVRVRVCLYASNVKFLWHLWLFPLWRHNLWMMLTHCWTFNGFIALLSTGWHKSHHTIDFFFYVHLTVWMKIFGSGFVFIWCFDFVSLQVKMMMSVEWPPPQLMTKTGSVLWYFPSLLPEQIVSHILGGYCLWALQESAALTHISVTWKKPKKMKSGAVKSRCRSPTREIRRPDNAAYSNFDCGWLSLRVVAPFC